MEVTTLSCISANTSEASCTGDVDAIVFDVHLVQAGLSGSILDGDSAILVVCDVRLGHLARWHSDLAFSQGQRRTVRDTQHRPHHYRKRAQSALILVILPVISPFWMVNGMTRSNGLSPATSRPFIPIGLSVAWETKGQRSDQVAACGEAPVMLNS